MRALAAAHCWVFSASANRDGRERREKTIASVVSRKEYGQWRVGFRDTLLTVLSLREREKLTVRMRCFH